MTRRLVCFALAAIIAAAPAAVGAQAPRAKQGLLSLEDARIFYEVVGSGEPIVVVHGGPGLDHNYMQPGLDRVLAGTHTLVFYDQRGTGRSSVELSPSAVSLEAFVSDIEALRQALGYEQITVLAHSFGTLFGLEYALRHPDRLRGLILMNPVEPGQRFQEQTRARQLAARTEEDAERLAELTASAGFEQRDPAVLSEVYRVAFASTFKDRARVDELNLELSSSTAQNGQAVGQLLGESLGQVDWWDRLAGLAAPTLVVLGRHDAPPVAMGQALVDAMLDASLAVLDSGHFPYIEDPEGLAEAVAAFFVDISR